MDAPLRAALSESMGSPVASVHPVGGGDVCEAFDVRLQDGRRLFVKHRAAAPPDFFLREAEGLAWLGEAGTIAVPEVLATRRNPPLLVLRFVAPAPPRPGFDERLGRALASLHRFGAPHFGWDRDNYLGPLRQPAGPATDWATFYGTHRLAPMLRAASDRGSLPSATRRLVERVIARLPELVGPPEPPSRLHGDLWSGNLHRSEAGEPMLVDPAVYGGHREVDLAMMRLFGGFSERVFAAYREAWPLSEGWRGRIPLYQLYPLLVHAALFGGSYAASVRNAATAALRAG